MGLTSLPFLVVLSVAAAATVVAAVWLWPRVAGHRPRHLAGRAGVLIVTQLMVVAAVLGWLNAYFTFYGAWSDLLGPPRPQPIVVTKRIVAGSARPRPSPSARAGTPAPQDGGAARSGEILAVRITGQRTGIKVPRSYLYLPPQYFQSAYSRWLFPVVLYLTGYPGDRGRRSPG